MLFKNFQLEMTHHNVNIRTEELVYEILDHIHNKDEQLAKKFFEEFWRLRQLEKFYLHALANDWKEESLNWNRLAEEGRLCQKDYETFSEELNGMTYADGCRLYKSKAGL
jgi:hypothetical protein